MVSKAENGKWSKCNLETRTLLRKLHKPPSSLFMFYVFHVLLGRTFVFGLHAKNIFKTLKT